MVIYVKKICEKNCGAPFKDLVHREGRALLKYALEKDFSVNADDYKEKKNEYGKPYLEGCPVKFSISHSGEYVACALSENEVGVDVEGVKSIQDRLLLRFIGRIAEGEREKTALWTEYEAKGKLLGVGIPYKTEDIQSEIFSRTYFEIDGYSLTVCSFENDFPAKLNIT